MRAGHVGSKRQSWTLDFPVAFQLVQVPADASDVSAFHTGRAAFEAPFDQGVAALLDLDAPRVVESLQFALCVCNLPCDLGILGEPPVAEAHIGLELGDAVGGSRDPPVKVIECWLAIGGPLLLGPRLAPSG